MKKWFPTNYLPTLAMPSYVQATIVYFRFLSPSSVTVHQEWFAPAVHKKVGPK